MINEVTDEDIEEAAAIDWSEVFKDSLNEPFDIKSTERISDDVELIEPTSRGRKPKQSRVKASEKRKKYCATLSKEQKKICRLTHHGTVIKEIHHKGSWHYGMEVCAECGRYIKFVPWPQHLWDVRDKIRSNWRKQNSQHFPLLPEPQCERLDVIKDDQYPRHFLNV